MNAPFNKKIIWHHQMYERFPSLMQKSNAHYAQFIGSVLGKNILTG
jgi:hypothetical protein